MDDALAPAADRLREACLVVEDDTIIRLDLEETLRGFGFASVIGTARADAAGRIAETARICLAVLDFEVGHGANTLTLAEQLVARGIPTVFLSAHGAALELPPALAHLEVVAKPFASVQLAEALQRAMTRAIAGRMGIPCEGPSG